MRRTLVQKGGPESVSLQALVPWGSLGDGLMGRRVRCTGEANDFRYYKRLGAIAKLATSYMSNRIVQGLGLTTPSPAGLHEAVERLHRQGYAGTAQYIRAQAAHANAPCDRRA
jgi:hypothetical protein